MALDRAFENTYHVDDNGTPTFHTRMPGRLTPHVSNSPMPGVSYRGLLMSPYTGTGKKQDPTIAPEERKQRIEKALNVTARGNLGEEDRQRLVSHAYESGIPTHMFDKVNVRTTISDYLPGNPPGVGGVNFAGKIDIKAQKIPGEEQRTLVHELGHELDNRTQVRSKHQTEDFAHSEKLFREGRQGESFTPSAYHIYGETTDTDPISEGTADGFQDRYSDTDRLSSSLKTRAKFTAESGSKSNYSRSRAEELARGRGYGAGHYDHPVDQAIYLATRAHAGVSKTPENQFPQLHHLVPPRGEVRVPQKRGSDGFANLAVSDNDAKEHLDSVNEAKEHFLGYMFHTHPHVRAALYHADAYIPDEQKQTKNGFYRGDLYFHGQRAAEKYRASQTSAAHTQPELGKIPWDQH